MTTDMSPMKRKPTFRKLASSFFELHSQCKYCIIGIMIAMSGKKYKN